MDEATLLNRPIRQECGGGAPLQRGPGDPGPGVVAMRGFFIECDESRHPTLWRQYDGQSRAAAPSDMDLVRRRRGAGFEDAERAPGIIGIAYAMVG